jgi:predicted Zn-dependent protease
MSAIAWLMSRVTPEPGLVMTRSECEALARRVTGMARGPGSTSVEIASSWRGDLRWGRHRVTLAGDRRTVTIGIARSHNGAAGTVQVSQVSDATLEAAVRSAEQLMYAGRTLPEDVAAPSPVFEYPKPRNWSDATAGLTAEARGLLARDLLGPGGEEGLLSAGFLSVGADASGSFGPQHGLYCARTSAQCSITTRDPKGQGAGWAGASSYDWSTIDAVALGRRSREKCLASRNPVAIEPGRYTVVLEPQAVGDLLGRLIYPAGPNLDRFFAEMGHGPFADPKRRGFSKLGLKVADERVTIGYDPEDPLLGMCPYHGGGEPYRRVNWIERGILQNLAYGRWYALSKLNENLGFPDSGAFRMSGGEASLEDMIRSTQRGLLVTRFSDIRTLDGQSLLQTGITRGGLWLIENGRISKPVKNLRFADSPLVVLNSIEQMGRPVPVFRPEAPMVVPPLKTRGFTFTRLVDAV